jgi:biopolymer transport protein ExbD
VYCVKGVNAAPFAALFLILATVLATASTFHGSQGLPLRLAKMVPCYPGDRRVVVIQVLAHRRLKMNVDPVESSELGDRLEEIFRTRAVRLAYVTAEPGLSFAEVVKVIEVATKHLDHVALLPHTSVVERRPYPGETDTCLDMTVSHREWGSSDATLPIWH